MSFCCMIYVTGMIWIPIYHMQLDILQFQITFKDNPNKFTHAHWFPLCIIIFLSKCLDPHFLLCIALQCVDHIFYKTSLAFILQNIADKICYTFRKIFQESQVGMLRFGLWTFGCHFVWCFALPMYIWNVNHIEVKRNPDHMKHYNTFQMPPWNTVNNVISI